MDDGRTYERNSKGNKKMKIAFKFIVFLIYTILLFWVQNVYVFIGIFIFQAILMFVYRIAWDKAIEVIIHLMPFILLTAVFNGFAMGLKSAIQIGIRLTLVCHITYIFGKTTSSMQIAKGIEKLLYPLEWFGINRKNITLMISIAITFIPIIRNEITNIKYSLMAKGMRMNIINQIKHLNYIMGPLFYSLLKKVKEIEEALKSKAYVEE